MKVEDAVMEIGKITEFWQGKRYIVFNMSCETADDEASTPMLRYIMG